MKRLWVAWLLLAGVVGCTEKAPTDITQPVAVPDQAQAGGEAIARSDIDVTTGDVEQKVRLKGTIEDADKPASGVALDPLADPRGMLNLLTVTLSPPHPTNLIVTYTLNAQRNFPDTPVVVRGRIVTDKTTAPLYEFQKVFGAKALGSDLVFKFDLLEEMRKQIPTLPETFLVTAEMETLLMPIGTDEATLDPATATTAPENITQAVPSNPIRVNFSQVPAALTTPAPATGTPPAPAAPQGPVTDPTGAGSAPVTPAPVTPAPATEPAPEATPAPPAAEAAPAQPAPEAAPAQPAPEAAPAQPAPEASAAEAPAAQ